MKLLGLVQIVNKLLANGSPRATKGDSMDLLTLLQGLTAQLQDAETALAEAKKASFDEGYAQGLADGKAQGGGTDKIYSQAELDAAMATAVQPLQDQIAALETRIAELEQSQQTAVDSAIAALKADLLAKYEAEQTAESDAESTFKQALV